MKIQNKQRVHSSVAQNSRDLHLWQRLKRLFHHRPIVAVLQINEAAENKV